MPTSHTLMLFAGAAFVLIAVPGPNALYIATRSVGQGRRAGIASALGVEIGALLHILAAAVGLSALIASSATAFSVLKYVGAAYLVFLGIRTLARRDADIGSAAPSAPDRTARVFAEGVLVNVLNPKVALFFVAFLPQFIDQERGAATTQVLALGVVFLAIGTIGDMTYALAAGALGARLRGGIRARRRRRRLSGGIYIALGAVAALGGGRRHHG